MSPKSREDGYNALAFLLSELTRPNSTVESFMGEARNCAAASRKYRRCTRPLPKGRGTRGDVREFFYSVIIARSQNAAAARAR